MRLAFAGTPEFARVALERLQAAGHEIALVLCQPDRPAGRGMRTEAAPVKAFALAQGLPVAQPRGLRLDGRFADDAVAARAALLGAAPEAIVVAAYGLILPPWMSARSRRVGPGASVVIPRLPAGGCGSPRPAASARRGRSAGGW